jgi:hypothetical protein
MAKKRKSASARPLELMESSRENPFLRIPKDWSDLSVWTEAARVAFDRPNFGPRRTPPSAAASDERRQVFRGLRHWPHQTYEELNSGRLRGRKIGTRTLISDDDAEAWFRCLPARTVGKTTT